MWFETAWNEIFSTVRQPWNNREWAWTNRERRFLGVKDETPKSPSKSIIFAIFWGSSSSRHQPNTPTGSHFRFNRGWRHSIGCLALTWQMCWPGPRDGPDVFLWLKGNLQNPIRGLDGLLEIVHSDEFGCITTTCEIHSTNRAHVWSCYTMFPICINMGISLSIARPMKRLKKVSPEAGWLAGLGKTKPAKRRSIEHDATSSCVEVVGSSYHLCDHCYFIVGPFLL